MHRQVWVKVNTRVDEGMKGIVAALSKFESLETIESCEGNDKRGPWVCFRYGSHPWRDLAEFVLGRLAPGLAGLGDAVRVGLYSTPTGQILGELSLRPGTTKRVEQRLIQLCKKSTS